MKFDALYGRQSGSIEIENDRVVFLSDDNSKKIIINFHSLKINIEGLNTQQYFLFDSKDPDHQICIQNIGALQLLADRGSQAAKKIVQDSQEKKIKKVFIYSLPVISILVLVVLLPLLLSFAPNKWIESLITPEVENKFADLIVPSLKSELRVVENHPAQSKLNDILEILKNSNLELNQLKTSIYISESSDVNAFATPGNLIIVNKGLIFKADSIDEIAGVIAHELGHIEQKHVVRRMTEKIGNLVGTIFLGTIIGFEAAAVISNVNDFVSLKYSRNDEIAADQRGAHFLKMAGFNHQGMIQFFEKLSANQKLPDVLSLLSTHPASQERVEVLKLIKSENSPDSAWPISLEELKSDFK